MVVDSVDGRTAKIRPALAANILELPGCHRLHMSSGHETWTRSCRRMSACPHPPGRAGQALTRRHDLVHASCPETMCSLWHPGNSSMLAAKAGRIFAVLPSTERQSLSWIYSTVPLCAGSTALITRGTVPLCVGSTALISSAVVWPKSGNRQMCGCAVPASGQACRRACMRTGCSRHSRRVSSASVSL